MVWLNTYTVPWGGAYCPNCPPPSLMTLFNCLWIPWASCDVILVVDEPSQPDIFTCRFLKTIANIEYFFKGRSTGVPQAILIGNKNHFIPWSLVVVSDLFPMPPASVSTYELDIDRGMTKYVTLKSFPTPIRDRNGSLAEYWYTIYIIEIIHIIVETIHIYIKF